MLDSRHHRSLRNRLLSLITGPWTEHRSTGRGSRLSLVGLEPMEARTHLSVTLVENINASGSSFPDDLINVNGTLFFTAQDGVNGEELWKSDGTANGTVLVKDIFSGPSESIPDLLVNVNGTLFFTADDGVNGRELWKSDGTTNGTVLVKDIRLGASGSNISNLTVVNGTLFFTANDGENGSEVWKSDGTESGTVLVKNVRLGASGSNPDSLTNVNGTLFFAADDGLGGGRELFKSDGTENGTGLVKDVLPGSGGSGLFFLTNVNGTLFFQASDDVNGTELWKSDGTESGTVLVKNIQADSGSSSPQYLASVNGTLFFSADDGVNGYEVWKSDGTESGTVLVKDIRSGATIGSFPTQLTNVNGTLFFNASDGVNGEELWKSDGTENGTVLVKDIRTGFSSFPSQFKNINGTLYFSARDSNAVGFELWKSDGTEEGTVLVQDIQPGAGSSNPTRMTDVNGSVFFVAEDGVNGTELFVEFVEPTISIGDVTVNEGDGTATLTVTLSQAVPVDVTVQYATANGSATQPGDYTTTTGTLTILANQLTGTFTVPIVNDSLSENAESFVVSLSSPTNATIADEQATVTIPLNDVPALSIGDVTVNEGDGTATLTVTLSQAAPFDVTVQHATANGTATQPGDYTTTSGTLTILANQTTGTFTVPIINDSLSENAESFVVNLTSPTNATIADAQATVTIPLNDVPALSIGDVTVNEGDGTATLTVTLSQAAPFDVTVQYATANGTATQPGDYTTTSGTLTILANQTTGTFTVPIVNDATLENAETFVVDLTSPTNATISDAQATVTIPLSDVPALSIGDVTVNEGAGTATLTVTLSQIAPFDVTVQHATANGTATQPGDYTTTTGTLTIVAGQTTGTFTVPIINDSAFENAETFVVNLTSPTNATIADAQATVTIPLNDTALVSFGGRVVATYLDSTNERVTVRLSGPGSGTVLLPGAADGTGDALLIEVTGATDKTSLSITVAGRGASTTIPTIQVTGALGRLIAPATTVTTSLSITGTAKSVTLAGISGQLTVGAPVAVKDKLALKLGIVSELNINAATPIGSLSVVEWQDNAGAADTITTPWIGSLSATGRKAKGLVTALAGDFEAGLLLSAVNAIRQVALGRATIAGKLSGSDWTLSGHAGTVTVGSISGSRIALGEGTQTVLNLKALTVKGSRLDVNGPAFVKSQVFLTGTLGSAKLNLVDLTQDLDNPSVSRFLGLRGDVLSLVNFRAAGVNTGKPVTLRNLLTTNDLADPKKNPANVAATTNQFKLVIV